MALYERHGGVGSPEYAAWHSMKDRCLNSNSCNWHRYGDRGIKIYEPWITSFKDFYDYVGPRPSNEHSIDRIDNDGNYEPGNVRWATVEQQVYNRSTNMDVELPNGRIVTTKEATKILNLSKSTLYNRIRNNTDLSIPYAEHKKGLVYKDMFKTWTELSLLHDVPAELIRVRISAGMDIEKAVTMPKQTATMYPYKSEHLTIPEIAEIEGIPDYLIRHHLRKDVAIREAIPDVIAYIKRNYDVEGSRLDIGRSHGKTGATEHIAWNNLRAKCYNPNNSDYQYWGAKGITICDRWLYSFPNFYNDLGLRPTKNHAVKIHDKSKPLGPGNASWQIHTPSSRDINYKLITLADGRQVNIHEAMAITGLKKKTIYERIRTNVPLEANLRGMYMYNGSLYTAEQLSEISGVPLKRLKKRLSRGYSLEKAMTLDLK